MIITIWGQMYLQMKHLIFLSNAKINILEHSILISGISWATQTLTFQIAIRLATIYCFPEHQAMHTCPLGTIYLF